MVQAVTPLRDPFMRPGLRVIPSVLCAYMATGVAVSAYAMTPEQRHARCDLSDQITGTNASLAARTAATVASQPDPDEIQTIGCLDALRSAMGGNEVEDAGLGGSVLVTVLNFAASGFDCTGGVPSGISIGQTTVPVNNDDWDALISGYGQDFMDAFPIPDIPFLPIQFSSLSGWDYDRVLDFVLDSGGSLSQARAFARGLRRAKSFSGGAADSPIRGLPEARVPSLYESRGE